MVLILFVCVQRARYPSDNACTGVESTGFAAMGYSIRTDQYRYTIWLGWDGAQRAIASWDAVHGEELYDHDGDDGMDTDKYENVNLGCAGQYAAICAKHKAALVDGWKLARPHPSVYSKEAAEVVPIVD